MSESVSNRLLTVSEVASALRVDDATVRRWVKQGVLEAFPLPRVNKRTIFRIKQTTLEQIIGQTIDNRS